MAAAARAAAPSASKQTDFLAGGHFGDEVGAVLGKFPTLEVEIGGHTDSRGSEELNKSLTQQRAQAALDYLREKVPGLDAGKYRVVGYGESTAIANDSTPEGQTRAAATSVRRHQGRLRS